MSFELIFISLVSAFLLSSYLHSYISAYLYRRRGDGYCWTAATWTTDIGDLGKFPLSSVLKYELSVRGLSLRRIYVIPRGDGVWHVVNSWEGWTLDDVPDTHRVGAADAGAAWQATVAVDKGAASRTFQTTRKVGPISSSGTLSLNAHERDVAASTKGSVSIADELAHLLDECRQLPSAPQKVRRQAWRSVDRANERYEACLDMALAATDSREAVVFRNAAMKFRAGEKVAEDVMESVESYIVDNALQAKAALGKLTEVATWLPSTAKSTVKTVANAIPRVSFLRRQAHHATTKVWQRVGNPGSESWRTLSALDLDWDESAEQVVGLDHFINLNEVDAIEAAKILNSSPDSLGEAERRMDVGVSTYKKGVMTSVPPSDPAYASLVRLLGPLAYRAKIEGHRAAATFRRAAVAHASRALEGARVGLVSPSNVELHTFPNAAVWRYDDGAVDESRFASHCTMCKAPECRVLAAARSDGRLLESNNLGLAADFFHRFKLQALLLINIEPNLGATDLLRLMNKAGVPKAYSLCSLDWRALVVREAHDKLIGMTTRREGAKVVSSFDDGGDYVQDEEKAKQLFRPTFADGCSLRRTILFGSDATQYFELTKSASLVATRCVPGHDTYYFLRVPTPEGTDHLLLVERVGFDRVLATYRTQAVRDITTARIVLRQSNVTYSIAGTQVTPRIRLSASEAEALAVWVVVYSEVQDVVAKKSNDLLQKPTMTSLISTSVWQGAKAQLLNTASGQVALGTASAVEQALGAYRRNIAEKTIDQLSDAAFEELFGSKISVTSLATNFFEKWSKLAAWTSAAWRLRHRISHSVLMGWRVTFGMADVAVVAGLLGVRVTAEAIGVLVDLAEFMSRVAVMPNVTANIRRLQGALNWPATKAERSWVVVQDAQKLDFQEAMIDIVETMFNNFARDWSAELRDSQELAAMDPAEVAVLEAQANLPYSDFLSEVKRFLTSYNNRVTRLAAINRLLHMFATSKREADPKQLQRMVHTLKSVEPGAVLDAVDLHFALGADLVSAPLPLRTIDHGGVDQDIRQCFHDNAVLHLSPQGQIASTLERLPLVNGRADFSVIHDSMELAHPGGHVNLANLAGPTSVSPDERGAQLVERLLECAVQRRLGVEFCPQAALRPWYQGQMASPALIEPVERILRNAEGLVDLDSQAKWIAHIDGLAMGGKSAGVRRWITNADLVIVPTRKLKQEWQESLGKQDPLHRASVVTQHEALVTKLTAGYVFVDEAYTFDPEHLQMLANRHHACKGMVTIGDGHQIGNVFTTTGHHTDTSLAPVRITAPVSFAPWDALAVYLEMNTSPARIERYFCGSDHADGLRYTLEGEDVLVPGVGDLPIQGTQLAKEQLRLRGLADCITAHESQGARSEHTIVHGAGEALQRDMRWLGEADQNKHAGVLITRARQQTIFVVGALDNLRHFRWVDQGVAGVLPNDVIWGGTSWDLVEPRVVNEAVETYIHEPLLPEQGLTEPCLTDPVTIGTVFVDGEVVSRSEIRAHVELQPGVRLIDAGIPHSDDFDDYTLQPRHIPGVDQIQALTRAVKSAKPTHRDFCDAERIVNRIFDQVIDPKIFFAHLANSKRNVLQRRERRQVIDGAFAETEQKLSTISFGFLKPEFAKKPSELSSQRGGELKAQGVITASAFQQALFMDACDNLTHAWARSMRQGKYSPVGLKEQDIDSILATFEASYELDLDKQDSSHKAVHVLVACRFLELASEHLGLDKVAMELRQQRSVRMMAEPFEFVLTWALASGDPWTLIFNKIMAVSSLISVADLTDSRMLQTGDDITLDRAPKWYSPLQIKAQLACNRGLSWKVEERQQRLQGVTFISRGALPNRTIVYKALRTILKYTHLPRTRLQHESFKVDTQRLKNASSQMGLQCYCFARCKVFGGDPVVVFDLWTRAIALAETPFEELPERLKDESEKPFVIHSKELGCFGYALAHAVKDNVTAINALAAYSRVTPTAVAEQACRDNDVPYIKVDENWAKRSKKRLSGAIERWKIKLNRAFVALYRDHAIAIVPNAIVKHSGAGKVVISWKSLHVDGIDVNAVW